MTPWFGTLATARAELVAAVLKERRDCRAYYKGAKSDAPNYVRVVDAADNYVRALMHHRRKKRARQ